jgi:hypothetical protein
MRTACAYLAAIFAVVLASAGASNEATPARRAGTLELQAALAITGDTGSRRFGEACAPGTLDTILSHTRSFTVVGGTGAYTGATGAGSIRREAQFVGAGAAGTDFVTGTIAVPGLDFDLVPPKISGATAKTVRAPKGARSARVTYRLKALDDVDGGVPVICKPKSGTRFRIGRTLVVCTATDRSGNSQVARFWVTVRRGG